MTVVEDRPYPKHYLEHAQEANSAAKFLLESNLTRVVGISEKISLGLSLQSVELVGKSMLRSLGHTPHDIRSNYRHHRVLQLLQDVQDEIQGRPENAVSEFQHFLLTTPTIGGIEFGSTIEKYLEEHFSQGPTAYPRNYFYPDLPTFIGPRPINTLCVVAQDLIDTGSQFAEAMGWDRR